MKKGVKITVISLGSFLGLVLILIGVALWLVFTPARLTSIVNSLSEKYVSCDSHFESVNLTLFSTFPDLGLEVNQVTLVSPIEGSDNDTLLQVGSLIVGIDVRSFLKNGNIIVKQLQLDNTKANLFVNEKGESNFDIFPPSEDTTSSTGFDLPDSVLLHAINVHNMSAVWTDLQRQMTARAQGVDVSIEGDMTQGDLDANLLFACDQLGMHSGSGNSKMFVDANKLSLSLKSKVKSQKSKVDLRPSTFDLQHSTLDLRLNCGEVAYRTGDDGKPTFVDVSNMAFRLDAEGDQQVVDGHMVASLPQAVVNMAGMAYCNEKTATHGDLVAFDIPFSFDLAKQQVVLDTASLTLDGVYRLNVNGSVDLPVKSQKSKDQNQESRVDPQPSVDVTFATNRWNVASLLKMLPATYTSWKNGMDLAAMMQLKGSCKGVVCDSVMPNVDVALLLDNGYWEDADVLPGAVQDVAGSLHVQIRSKVKGQKSKVAPQPSTLAPQFFINAQLCRFYARWNNSDVVVDATANDVLGKMPFSAHVKANVSSNDVAIFVPDSMPISFSGKTFVEMDANSTLAQVQKGDWQRMQAQLRVQLDSLDVRYDSIHLATPNMAIEARLADGGASPTVDFDFVSTKIDGNYGLLGANVQSLVLKGSACLPVGSKVNSLKSNVDPQPSTLSNPSNPSNLDLMDMLRPTVSINAQEATVFTPSIQQVMRLNELKMDYADGRCDTIDISMVCGLSDYHLTGYVDGVEDFLVRKEMLRGRLDFRSNYTDVDQLMSLFSGMGTDKDTLEVQKQEAPATANPFIVPKNVDIVFNTNINNCVAFGNRLSNVGGELTVNDGVVVLEQMGFVCKAAKMQLTGVYKSPRFNHLFTGLDFHLLDIQIDELIDMIPTIDTLVPMLKSFKGNADFHLAAETYLFADYKPKYSTMLGAAAISGKDLVVLDNETFDKISSLLMFKKKTENKIDSLDVEMTVFRNELEVFPFVLSMDKYQVCVSGRHTLDNLCNYHLELLKCPLPIRLAVDIKGDLKKPKISLGSVRYAELYKPEKQDKLQQRTLEIKKQVRDALKRNVRPTSK